MVKKWNIRFRPSWPERLPRPSGWLASAERRRSRAVSIADGARITMSACALRRRPLWSRYDTPLTRERFTFTR